MNIKQLNQYEQNKKYRKNMYCIKCNNIYHNTLIKNCNICGKALIPYTTNIPKCPTCQSSNIKSISGTKRIIHGYAFGLFSKTARSQFECLNCGYKW